MEHELHSRIKLVHGIAPAAIVATTNSAAIDTQGFESCEFVFHVGTAMVGGGFDVTLQQSATGAFGGEETAVPAANIVGALPTIAIGDANKVFRVGTIGKERYQRAVMTETGTITGGVVGCMAILSHPQEAPVADQFT
jgi:hypothetical protein